MNRRLVSGAIGMAIAAMMSSSAYSEEFWIKAEGSGCEIWSDEAAQETDLLTWSGGCDPSGKATGRGLAEWLRGDKLYARYSGSMSGGRLNGPNGLLMLATEEGGFDIVLGSFRNGEADGAVTIVGSDASLFQGQYRGGARNGPGVLVDQKGNAFVGIFANDKADGPGRSIDADGEEYIGTFKDNNRHGQGVVYTSDGQVYAGGFADDKASGQGRYEGPGGYFEGNFVDNVPNGLGRLVAEDGKTYQGNFVNGEPDGMVLVTEADGSQSVETWEKGQKIK